MRKRSSFKHFRVGIVLSVLLLMMVSFGWAVPTATDMQPSQDTIQPVSATATVTFSEAMDPATVTAGSFTLSRFVKVKAVAAGGYHSLALKEDGSVAAWGWSSYNLNYVPPSAYPAKAIASGLYHNVVLKEEGSVIAWGYNSYGQIATPAGLSNVIAIAAGKFHTVALKDDGNGTTVIAWGANHLGQCTVPLGLSGVTAIAAGGEHTVALQGNGTVAAWGSNNYGQTTVPANLFDVIAIAAGESHTVALKNDGTVVSWGQLPTVPSDLNNVVAIAAGRNYNVALKNDGTVVAWGSITQPPTDLSGVVVIGTGPQATHAIAVKNDGTVAAWGDNSLGKCAVPSNITGIKAIATGSYHTVGLKNDDTVAGWGSNTYGESVVPSGLTGVVAIDATTDYTVVLKNDGTVENWGYCENNRCVVPAGLSGVTAIAAGFRHALALTGDRSVVAWGGQTSYGETAVPAGLNGVTTNIYTGGNHSLALKNDHTVVAWGRNDFGQSTVPTGLTDVSTISAGFLHNLALKTDGTVVAWGRNDFGQSTVPINLSGVSAVAAGTLHSVALKDNGMVVAWGDNSFQQTNVPELSEIIAIATGAYHTLALKNNGTVTAWGYNSNGQCDVPAGLSGVIAIAAEGNRSVALKADGTVAVWGNLADRTSVSPNEQPVDGNVVYDNITNTATFTPSAPLQPLSPYVVTVNTGARSAVGDHLAEDVRWNFTTDKLPATIILEGLDQTYDGTPRVVTATTIPPDLTVEITYNGGATAPTNAGSYTVEATVVDSVYKGSVTHTLEVAKANAQFNFAGLNQTYNGSPRAVTVLTIPEGLSFDLTYDGNSAAPTNAGEYRVVATINETNYQGSNSITLTVAKAAATITLSGLNQTYANGAPREVIATTEPAGLKVNVFYDNSAVVPTNAGVYSVSAIIDELNYTGSIDNQALTVAKAAAAITLSDLNQTYANGAPREVIATTEPAGLNVNVFYDGSSVVPTNAGGYSVSAIIDELNYEGSIDNQALTVAKAAATITLSGLNQTYANGAPREVIATTVPAGLKVNILYDSSAAVPTDAGVYSVSAIIDELNYTGSIDNQTLTVAKADQVITFNCITSARKQDFVQLSATVDSPLTVTFSVVSGPAVLDSQNVLTFTAKGQVEVKASQTGNNNYNAAVDEVRTILVQ